MVNDNCIHYNYRQEQHPGQGGYWLVFICNDCGAEMSKGWVNE